ncbi:MAG: arginine N-succinyltransferase, partial [Planctomycetes bacterium]|nr:arginine N-succinyltransferase [Planctomycetota bacterium]
PSDGRATWTNWSGSVTSHPQSIERPKTEAELIDLIGKANETAKAAVSILKKLGFRYLHQVDPFDGGPYVGAARDAIGSVRERRQLVLPALADERVQSEDSPLVLLSAEARLGFRATVVPRSFTVSLKEKGELKAAKSADVKCEVEGRSTIISLVAEGTSVNKGDLLVELASDAIENRIREAELKETNSITAYESAKTELDIQRDKNSSDIRKAGLAIELRKLAFDKYQKGEWVQASKDAQIAIEQAEMSLERREQDFIGAEKLFEKNFTTRTEFEEMKFNFQKAKWNLQKAELAQDVLERYTHVADLKQRQSDVEEAIKEAERVKKTADGEELRKARNLVGRTKELELIQDQLAKLRQQRTKCRIYAPTQGFVVYYSGGGRRFFMSSDQQIKVGAQVIERQVLIELPDTSVMLAVVRVHETKTDRLRLGQKTVLTVEGFPGRRFTGTVTKIAVLADSQSSWLNPDLKEYETEITLDPTDAKLKPGVTAHAEILVDTIDDKLAVPVQAVYSKGGRRYVFRDKGNTIEHVPVELGGIGLEWVEIVDGLADGDRVLLAFSDEMKRSIPDVSGDGKRRQGSGYGAKRATGSRKPSGASKQHGEVRKAGNQDSPPETKDHSTTTNSATEASHSAESTTHSQDGSGQAP